LFTPSEEQCCMCSGGPDIKNGEHDADMQSCLIYMPSNPTQQQYNAMDRKAMMKQDGVVTETPLVKHIVMDISPSKDVYAPQIKGMTFKLSETIFPDTSSGLLDCPLQMTTLLQNGCEYLYKQYICIITQSRYSMHCWFDTFLLLQQATVWDIW